MFQDRENRPTNEAVVASSTAPSSPWGPIEISVTVRLPGPEARNEEVAMRSPDPGGPSTGGGGKGDGLGRKLTT